MKTPPHIIAYRSVTATIALLILLAFGFGVAGYGPFAALHGLTGPVSRSLHLDTVSG
jgi:hypothetical protein